MIGTHKSLCTNTASIRELEIIRAIELLPAVCYSRTKGIEAATFVTRHTAAVGGAGFTLMNGRSRIKKGKKNASTGKAIIFSFVVQGSNS